MRITRHRSSDIPFHAEGWSPALAAVAGALGFGAIAALVLVSLLALADAKLGASWAFPVFVTSIGAGGAGGLTLKNLNLKRAESRRALNLMFDDQFRTGAQLLGGSTESEVIAGAQLLGVLLRESPRHAQACADLLCARLRMPNPSDRDAEERDDLWDQDPPGLRDSIAEAHRLRNSISDAISRAISADNAPSHLYAVRWQFDSARFGNRTRFEGCLFGSDTSFRGCSFPGEVSMTGSSFNGQLEFARINAALGLRLGGIRAEGSIVIADSSIVNPAHELAWGIYLENCFARGVTVERVLVDGPIHLDTAIVEGDVSVVDCESSTFSFIDGRCDRSILLSRVAASAYICIRNTLARKGVDVRNSTAAHEIEVSSVQTLGVVRIEDCKAPLITRWDSNPTARP